MSTTIKIVSAVLNAVVGDKVGSGLVQDLIGISIDEASEKSINEIADFIDKEKFKIGRILSEENLKSMGISENKIDYVIVEIKDLFFKVSITDEVLEQCRYDSMNLSAFLWNKYREYRNDYIECESEIKQCLFVIAETIIKLVRESEEFEKDVLVQISNSVDDTNAELQNISGYLKENFSKLDDNSQMVLNILLKILEQTQKMSVKDNKLENRDCEKEKFQNNKKQQYIDIWNGRLFLHADTDENPLTLADAFIMPDYEIHKAIQKMRYSYSGTLDGIIKEFAEYERTSTMLITGAPGIGKSTITSWMANKYKDDDRFIILRFRDWDSEELEQGLQKAICNELECENKDLNDKILILDGFDEMKSLDIRNRLLHVFFNDIKDRKNFKCIITSRPAYIDSSHFQNVIELKEFNINKVDAFYRSMKGRGLTGREKMELNLEVLGIPVILYMAIMSGIDINENHTKPELYNKIFAEEGGIFDKFYDGKNEYSEGSQIMRDSDNIEKYLKFLCEIAYKMFADNKQNLKTEVCKVPELVFQKDTVSILEFPIKHLFENTETNIEFIHKSIYEYFVSEFIYIHIIKRIGQCGDRNYLAGEIAGLLNCNHLSEEICEFLKYKVSQKANANSFNGVFDTFNLMIRDGMTYHMADCCKNIIKCEMNVFANMLEIIHLWNNGNFVFDSKIFDYLKYNYGYELNLSGIDLAGKNLSKLLLTNVNLSNARLDSANLGGMDLRSTKFIGASIGNINLDEAILDGAIFSESQVTYLDKKYNLSGIKVYCSTSNKVLNYEY